MHEIRQLIDGFDKFRRQYYEGHDRTFDQLKAAQTPSILVIACSDSRVDPAILLDAVPGQLFVVRNVANLVPPRSSDGGTHGVSAALEFAVTVIGVRHIIVLGHSQCGGIGALLGGADGEFISQWMKVAQAAKLAHGTDLKQSPRDCEQRAILLSLENLKTFPWIQNRLIDHKLTLHGWYFDLAAGELLGYDESLGRFENLQR